MTPRIAALLAVSTTALLAGLPAFAQEPDFGADTSVWANDGQCDDPRFEGPGVAATTVPADSMADATDCRAAFQAGTATLIGGQGGQTAPDPVAPDPVTPAAGAVDFGSDTSQWANDGECDDPRFEGPGVAANPVQADTMADATDCRAAVEAGTATLIGGQGGLTPETPATPEAPTTAAAVNFGDDSSEYANDGECDDRRFIGQGMATSVSWTHVGRDATDCRGLYESGSLRLWNPTEAAAATQCASISFGTDAGAYPNDGECDDPRFEGLGTAFVMDPANVNGDATDCTRLCAFGVVSLRDY